MRSTGSDGTYGIVDRLPLRLESLIGGSCTQTVVIVVDARTATELGLVASTRAPADPPGPSGAGRRARLARRRYEMGLTQEGLAREIDVQPSTVGRWERGTTTPHLWARDRLCRALDVSRAELNILLGEPGPGEPVRLLHVVEMNDDGDGGEAAPAVGIA